MPLAEINFDGIIGPSHNYSGLSLGNIASATNKGLASHPRAAALQGLEKMRHNLRLGLPQHDAALHVLARQRQLAILDQPWTRAAVRATVQNGVVAQ